MSMKHDVAVVANTYLNLGRSSSGTELTTIFEYILIAHMDSATDAGDFFTITVPITALKRWGFGEHDNFSRDMDSIWSFMKKLEFKIETEKKITLGAAFPRIEMVDKTVANPVVQIWAANYLKPHLLNLTSNFTKIELEILIERLDSHWARKVYPLLRSKLFRDLDFFKYEVSIEDFRSFLGITGNTYSDWSTFKKQVLDPSIKDISEKSDIHIEYKAIRRFRKGMVALEFWITSKESYQQPALPNSARKLLNVTPDQILYCAKIGFNNLDFLSDLNYKEKDSAMIDRAIKLHENMSEGNSAQFVRENFKRLIVTCIEAQKILDIKNKKQKLQSKEKKSEPQKSTSEEIDAYILIHRASIEKGILDDIRAASPEAREFAVRQEARERLRAAQLAPPGN